MNFKRIATLVCVMSTGTLLSSTALAADASDWAGPYVGIHAGYGMDNGVSLDVLGLSSNSFDMNGAIGGVQAGYNWAMDWGVVGIEGKAALADVDGSALCSAGFSDTCGAKMDQLYTIQGRIGIPLDKFLIYGAVGAASAQIEARDEVPFFGTFSDSSYQTGWLLGFGGAMAFNNHWNGFVEVQYLDMGTSDFTIDMVPVSVENQFITLTVGGNYRF